MLTTDPTPGPEAIETGAHLRAARHALGWSLAQMGQALMLSPGKSSEDRLRQMEDDRGREISGPIKVAVLSFLAGFRPPSVDWE